MVLLKVPSSNQRANLKFRVMRNTAPDRRGVLLQRSCGLLTLPARSVPRRKVARSPKSHSISTRLSLSLRTTTATTTTTAEPSLCSSHNAFHFLNPYPLILLLSWSWSWSWSWLPFVYNHGFGLSVCATQSFESEAIHAVFLFQILPRFFSEALSAFFR